MTTTTTTRPTADELNAHLEAGGVIQLTTYTNSTVYDSRHAGWFSEGSDGSLYVRHGRRRNCIGTKSGMLVGIRRGRYVTR